MTREQVNNSEYYMKSLADDYEDGDEIRNTVSSVFAYVRELEKDKARLDWLEADAEPPASATHLVGDMQVLVPLSGLIDKDAELTRLNKEIEKKIKDRARAEGKINNPSFVAKAPEAVVQKEKDKVVDLNSAIEQLEAQKIKVAAL